MRRRQFEHLVTSSWSERVDTSTVVRTSQLLTHLNNPSALCPSSAGTPSYVPTTQIQGGDAMDTLDDPGGPIIDVHLVPAATEISTVP